ncbi:MAG: ribosomal protein L7/L12 [Planctomycetaceae bacterium]|nr:ribosomal protein L7/L12 [Planctomycetaceae bacterium]
MSESVTDKDQERIFEALYAGKKIEAIKIYRECTGKGLKDAKDFIDALHSRLRDETPEKFSESSGVGCGTGVLLLCGVVIIAALGASMVV